MKKVIVFIFALTIFTISISAQPNLSDENLKNCASENNNQKAIELCTNAIAEKPTDYRGYYYRGTAYLNLKTVGGFENAEADYKKCVELNPKFDDGHYLLGYVIAVLDDKNIVDYELAVKSFSEAIKLNSDRKEIYYYRGESYRKAADKLSNFLYNDDWETPESKTKTKNYFESAVFDYQKSLQINQPFDLAWLKLGIVYKSLEQYESALTALNKLVETKPNDKRAYENRCYSYFGLKKFQLALTDCDKALEINKTSSENVNNKEKFAAIIKLVREEIVKEIRKTSAPKKPINSTKRN